jgi:hypothetical protein
MPSINLIGYDNGAGLSRDAALLADLLQGAGWTVTRTVLRGDRRGRGGLDLATRLPRWLQRLRHGARPRVDINLHIERVRPLFAGDARYNLLLANPDWFKPSDRRHLAVIDGVLVKTRHAEPIFTALGARTVFTGFTALDRWLPQVPRRRTFFHLAGRSPYKGTQALLALWQRHPEWPPLTVVQHGRSARGGPVAPNIEYRRERLEDARLRELQNAHWFHLCPSETEGFGHHLVEAMSVGALVLTTDAPPMNEFVTAERGMLVSATVLGRDRLATRYRFDAHAMEAAIERALALPESALRELGARARSWYLDNDREFRARLPARLADWLKPAHDG